MDGGNGKLCHGVCARTIAESEKRAIERVTDLLELLDGTLVDTAALVDQVTGLPDG